LHILDDRIGAQGPRAGSKDEDGTTAKRPPPSLTGWAGFSHPAFQPEVLDRRPGRPGNIAGAQRITEFFRTSWTMSHIVPFFPCECRGHQAGHDSPALREGRRPFAFCLQREPGPDGSLRLGASAPWRQTSLPPRRSSLPPSLAIRHRLVQAHSGSFKVIQAKSTLKKLSGPRPRFTPLLPGLQPVRHGSPIDGGSLGDEVCASHPLRLIGRDFPPSMPHPLGILSPKVTPRVPLRLCAFHPLRLIPPPRHAARLLPEGNGR